MGRCAMPRAPRPIPLYHRATKAQINPGLYPSLDERRGSGQMSKSRKAWAGGRVQERRRLALTPYRTAKELLLAESLVAGQTSSARS